MTIEQKLKALILQKYKSIKDFAATIEIPYTTIDSIFKRGLDKANIMNVIRICAELGISADHLSSGEIVPRVIQGAPTATPAAQRIAHAYDAAPPPIRNIVDAALEPYVEAKPLRLVTPPDAEIADELVPEIVLFPDADFEACAGMGNYLIEADRFTLKEFPRDSIPPRASFAVTIKGDSMQPKFYSGDTVFVQGMPRIDIGDYGIFIVNGEAMCKRLASDGQGRPYLHPLNPEYPDIFIDENTEVITCGRIIGHK